MQRTELRKMEFAQQPRDGVTHEELDLVAWTARGLPEYRSALSALLMQGYSSDVMTYNEDYICALNAAEAGEPLAQKLIAEFTKRMLA